MWRPRQTFLAASVGVALAAAFSCKTFDLPAETCDPSTLHTTESSQVRSDLTRIDLSSCGRCLEDHCCDVVGACQAKEGCAAVVRETQTCALTAKLKNATSENDCAVRAGLTEGADGRPLNVEADSAYRCMRGACGAQCGLPVCKVDKSALLIRNAKCDACFAGACCEPLNRCYESRPCKLMLECLIGECGAQLGESLVGLPVVVTPWSDSEAETRCAARPTRTAEGCVLACFCRYRDNEHGLAPENPALLPFNLARSVHDCGRRADCSAECKAGSDKDGAP